MSGSSDVRTSGRPHFAARRPSGARGNARCSGSRLARSLLIRRSMRLLLMGLVLVAGCGLATRREVSGSGGSGPGGGTGFGGAGVPIHGELPEQILPAGGAGAGGSPPKISCADSPGYTLAYSPGYPQADHERLLEMARALRGQMTTLKQKAEQLRGTFSGEGSTNWEDIQRSYDNDELQIRGWQYRDGPRGLNIDQPVFVGKD